MALSPWYVTGFLEGNGVFTYSRSSRGVNLYLAVKLNTADRGILEEIQAYFGGIGRIYTVKSRAAEAPGSGVANSSVYYRVSRKYQLMRVLHHFELYPLQGIKAAAFQVWKDMVLLKTRDDRVRRFDLLNRLALKLSSLSPRKSPFFGRPPLDSRE